MAKRTERYDDDEQKLEGAPQEDFYASEVGRYQAIVDRDIKEAFHRYGFTLYHSLPPAKQVEVSQKMGFWHKDAVDYYNLAGVAIQREDYSGAVQNLNRA